MNLGSETRDLVRGLYDTHVHPGPGIFPRVADAIEIVQAARTAGMGGVVFKAYGFQTGPLARMLERLVAIAPKQAVVIAGEREALHKYVVRVLNACYRAGISDISFAALRR